MDDWAGGEWFFVKLLFNSQSLEKLFFLRKTDFKVETVNDLPKRRGRARNQVTGPSSIILAKYAVLSI
jgi:hypothetical protein